MLLKKGISINNNNNNHYWKTLKKEHDQETNLLHSIDIDEIVMPFNLLLMQMFGRRIKIYETYQLISHIPLCRAIFIITFKRYP